MREAFLKFLDHLDEDLDPTATTENIEEKRKRLKEVFSGFLTKLDKSESKSSTVPSTLPIRGTAEHSRTLLEKSSTTEINPQVDTNSFHLTPVSK